MLKQKQFPTNMPSGLCFSILTDEEIRKMSIKEITNLQAFDALAHPTYGGLYDPCLGKSHLRFVVLS